MYTGWQQPLPAHGLDADSPVRMRPRLDGAQRAVHVQGAGQAGDGEVRVWGPERAAPRTGPVSRAIHL